MSKGQKLTSASIVRTLCRDLPGADQAMIRRVWHASLRVMQEALLSDTTVVIHGIGTVTPYVKKSCKKYDIRTEGLAVVPDRRYVRFVPSVGLLAELRKLPVA